MTNKTSPHTFHIPVMGTGFTVDTPIKVAHYGINSVISIGDHRLLEKMREYHCSKRNIDFVPIPESNTDSRAERITAYLNLVADIVEVNFTGVKNAAFQKNSEITKYFDLLPDTASLKKEYIKMIALEGEEALKLQARLREKIRPGAIDVNIMTKLDKVNYDKSRIPLPDMYNDAHAALRGFANSSLSSSIVFSAGLNPRLYSYASSFKDFLPDSKGEFKKKITLKVSDYRSALIQGKFFAKRGLWVSEFRIESGLNCGGHAFATDGYLLGPILEEFKVNRSFLYDTLFSLYSEAMANTSEAKLPETLPFTFTVQGGVGTALEHRFLLEYYNVDSVGWGSPFLLVPEAVHLDKATRELLCQAEEEDLYLSNVSPMGVPFNTVKKNSADQEKLKRIAKGEAGAPCVKEHLCFNTEFSEKPLCLASKKYQTIKISELKAEHLTTEEYLKKFNRIVDKICLCIGLSNSVQTQKNDHSVGPDKPVIVCPGPNMAYFSKVVSLKTMVDHIYGRTNIIKHSDRPNMFMKELRTYIDYLQSKIEASDKPIPEQQNKYLISFQEKMNEGIAYYNEMTARLKKPFEEIRDSIQNDLAMLNENLNYLILNQQLKLSVV